MNRSEGNEHMNVEKKFISVLIIFLGIPSQYIYIFERTSYVQKIPTYWQNWAQDFLESGDVLQLLLLKFHFVL